MIRVLIVDDSPTARLVLTRECETQPDFKVVGAAADAFEARRLILTKRPDVITLDLQMPRMSGLEFLRRIMAHHPLPVVVVSSLAAERGAAVLEALQLGAVDVVGKARLGSDGAASAPLVDAIRAAGQANLRRSATRHVVDSADRYPPIDHRSRPEIVAVGASTGGTRAIEELLRQLTGDFPGIVIAQHLPAAFTHSFAARLNAVSDLSVREARHGDVITAGTVLIAPGGSDTTVVRTGHQLRVAVAAPHARAHSPSVNALFRSVAASCGSKSIGVLLTGMGDDGAEGLAAMRRAGALTVAEHEETCVVYGMPRAAIEIGAAAAAAPLHDIPALLLHSVGRRVTARI
ncbi:MAG: chemotaxis-specific protein-glutamate methyltransferase CheB [Gemmatimonadota bacterium]